MTRSRRPTDSGERTSTRELLAAIVCAFEPTADNDWHTTLRGYRRSRVRDLLEVDAEAGNVVRLERRRPGRPSATAT